MRSAKILVRATNWVGDAVMSVPALQLLRETYPAAHIAILARPWVADLYGRESFCDELIRFEAPQGWGGLRQKWRMVENLSSRHFDCAILLPNSFGTAAFVRLSRIPIRIGYARDARSLLLTHPIPVPRSGETLPHQRFYYLELLKRAGLVRSYDTSTPIRLSDASNARDEGQARLSSVFGDKPVIGVSPGAAYGGAKRWLPERFAESAVKLAQEREAAVALFGSQPEASVCERIRAAIHAREVECISFAGRTSLAQFIEMAAACELFLTNDSGPMHIASALGIPLVAIFGATDEKATGPTGSTSLVIRHNVECSPCLLHECPIDHRCMTSVSSATVTEAAQNLLTIHHSK